MALKTLTESDYESAAKLLGCEVAAVKAVAEVESPKGGFLLDGRPSVLFEAHKFSDFTDGHYDESHPRISSPSWNRKLYEGPVGEWERLSEAIALDREAALMSASWGRFQIMGFNYAICGFSKIQAFVSAMYESEGHQLRAFVKFVINREIDDEIRRHDWAAFARIYNGPAFAKNQYHVKLAAAYRKYAAEAVTA